MVYIIGHCIRMVKVWPDLYYLLICTVVGTICPADTQEAYGSKCVQVKINSGTEISDESN